MGVYLGYRYAGTVVAAVAMVALLCCLWLSSISSRKGCHGYIDVNKQYFAQSTSAHDAISAIIDGGLYPSTFKTCDFPICGTPGVYFLPTNDKEDIKAAWKQLIMSAYRNGAMFIVKQVGVGVQGRSALLEANAPKTNYLLRGVAEIIHVPLDIPPPSKIVLGMQLEV